MDVHYVGSNQYSLVMTKRMPDGMLLKMERPYREQEATIDKVKWWMGQLVMDMALKEYQLRNSHRQERWKFNLQPVPAQEMSV